MAICYFVFKIIYWLWWLPWLPNWTTAIDTGRWPKNQDIIVQDFRDYNVILCKYLFCINYFIWLWLWLTEHLDFDKQNNLTFWLTKQFYFDSQNNLTQRTPWHWLIRYHDSTSGQIYDSLRHYDSIRNIPTNCTDLTDQQRQRHWTVRYIHCKHTCRDCIDFCTDQCYVSIYLLYLWRVCIWERL